MEVDGNKTELFSQITDKLKGVFKSEETTVVATKGEIVVTNKHIPG